ncbi:unnamed protein product, partial [Allacma fusca]
EASESGVWNKQIRPVDLELYHIPITNIAYQK